MTDPHIIVRSLSPAQRKEPAMTSERERLTEGANDFSRITLRSNIETILRTYQDINPHMLTDKIMSAIPRISQSTTDDHYRELVRTGWQPPAPEPVDPVIKGTREILDGYWNTPSGEISAWKDEDYAPAKLQAAATVLRRLLSEAEARGREAERPVIDVPEGSTCWLIEFPDDDCPCPRWWAGPAVGWVYDANEAIHYNRERDAIAGKHDQRILGKVTEHKFLSLIDGAGVRAKPVFSEEVLAIAQSVEILGRVASNADIRVLARAILGEK